MEGTTLKKVTKIIALFVLMAILSGCASKVAYSTESADNATPGIEAVMREISNQEFETLAAFDSNGRLLFETTAYESSSVSVTSDQLQQFWAEDGALMMHNHPSGSTFSAVDLRAEAMRGTRRAIVVTDRFLYVLEPGKRGWGSPERLFEAYTAYAEQYAIEAGQNPDLATLRARVIWAQHQALMATAADFGLSYQQVPMDEVFCFQGIYIVTAG